MASSTPAQWANSPAKALERQDGEDRSTQNTLMGSHHLLEDPWEGQPEAEQAAKVEGVGQPGTTTETALPAPTGWLQFSPPQANGQEDLGNLQTIVSLLQTSGQGLSRVASLLEEASILADWHWVNGNHDSPPPAELTEKLGHLLEQVERVATSTRFHGRGLLGGQSGVVGRGNGVRFVRGGPRTASSGPEGYSVVITQYPSQATVVGGVVLHQDWLANEQELFLGEGEQFVRFKPKPDESVEAFLVRFQEAIRWAGLDLEVSMTRQRRLMVRHNQFGSHFRFKAYSKTTPLLSKQPGRVEWSAKGQDIGGTIGGEPAFGIGRMLVGYLDNLRTSELAVLWEGQPENGQTLARCQVRQNSLEADSNPPEGGEVPVRLHLPDCRIGHLGCWVETREGYSSLAEVANGTWAQVQASIQMLFSVENEAKEWLERVNGWIAHYQNRALACLRGNMWGADVAPLTPQPPQLSLLLEEGNVAKAPAPTRVQPAKGAGLVGQRPTIVLEDDPEETPLGSGVPENDKVAAHMAQVFSELLKPA